MSSKPAAAGAAYVPDEEILLVLQDWHAARAAVTAAEEAEGQIWERLNQVLDERVGVEKPAVFITALGEFDPAKAGRTYPTRGAGVDYDALAEAMKAELGAATFRRFFTTEKVTVNHPNIEALQAIRETDPKIDALVTACTNEGTPTLTKVPPAKASKELAKAAVPLPAAASAKGRQRPHVVA